jgi:hypothetical protein
MYIQRTPWYLRLIGKPEFRRQRYNPGINKWLPGVPGSGWYWEYMDWKE